ncbi:uncharacterized protein LOC129568719 [Sitodiplosis mosellana]|uniref:uncharacterized protein LOC129568719 n=1 Tax=Sitodiplosis mosellana TaxID=263140 RepID=UPI002443F45A|nr:uncharacterized protein LOC129568719 [Sitodiplosis mosellana]
MECNRKYGRHLVAKCDIDVGKVILAEDAFISMPIRSSGVYELCGKCFKNSMNFIACENCATTVFCSRACVESGQFHKLSCGSVFSDNGYADGLEVYVTRSILLAANIFPNIENLITFVEGVVNDGKRNKVPPSIADMESKYHTFLKLNIWMSDEETSDLFGRAINVFLKAVEQPAIKAKIRSKEDNCFLMHLSLMHTRLIYSNSFQDKITGGIFLIQNHMNHSCAPNVLRFMSANKTVCITSRKVRKGEQIFTNYGDDTLWFGPIFLRQETLYRDFGFHCDCEKCSLNNWPISFERIKLDPDYQYFQRERKHLMFNDKVKCKAMEQTCLRILAKHSGMPWNAEVETVCNYLQNFLSETALYS